MVRWPRGLHPQGARRNTSQLAWRPGWRGTGMMPIRRIPVGRYQTRVTVPLNGGQVQGVVSGAGSVTLQIGPQGLGVTWYPVQITVSTSTGVLDTSTCLAYLGPLATPATLIGTVFTGNGTVGTVPPSVSPGQVLIFTWTGGHAGDIAAANVIGTMDALITG